MISTVKSLITHIFILAIILVSLSCDRKVSVNEPYEFEIGITEYVISSNPQGARIYYDEKFTGKFTPDTVEWVSAGEHKFTIKLFPFLDYSFTDVIKDSTSKFKEYDFFSNPLNRGSIKFLTNPKGCNVELDDSLRNFKTPFVLEDVTPGYHRIAYTYPEHREDSLTVLVLPQKQTLAELDLVDTTYWVVYNISNSDITDNTITDILIDQDNTFWIGTAHKGLIKIKNGKQQIIDVSNSNLANNIIHRIKQDFDNNIWVGTYGGISKITSDGIITYTTQNSSLQNDYIRDFDFDRKGNLWIGTERGLSRFINETNWLNYSTENSSIPENFITAVLVDNYDNLWIGTNEFNTHQFDGVREWITFQADTKLVGDSVSDLIIGPDNNLWVGLITEFYNPNNAHKPGGIYRMTDGILGEFNLDLANKSVHRFFKDQDNILWVGTKSGVLTFDRNLNRKLINSVSSGLPVDDILAIARENNGNMWFGTNGAGLVLRKSSAQ